MEELTIIIPVHEYNETIEKYLYRAIESVEAQTEKPSNIIIVGPKEVIDTQKQQLDTTSIGFELITNEGQTDYCSQINLAVKSVTTKYFSILEFDDYYQKNWVKNVNIYTKFKPDFSIFLPIAKFVNVKDEEVCLANEILWSLAFANELGVIDSEMLQSYGDFSVPGGVIRTDDFIEIGGLKPSIKLSFWYEFLLRASNNGVKAFVIPKTGYIHTIERKDSLMDQYTIMEEKERLFWIELAKKEYYFVNERADKAKYVEKKKLADIIK